MRKHWTEYKHEGGFSEGKDLCLKPSLDILQGREDFNLEHANYILWLEGLEPIQEENNTYTLPLLVWSIIVKNDWHKNGLPEE